MAMYTVQGVRKTLQILTHTAEGIGFPAQDDSRNYIYG